MSGDDPAGKSRSGTGRLRLVCDYGGMPMDASPDSVIAPSHIPVYWIRLTAEIVPIMANSNRQSALKNLREEDNYALA